MLTQQTKTSMVVFHDEITLLKQLGYDYISFYHSNLQTLVIYNPLLLITVRSFKVQNIRDYAFRDDLKYFYIFDYESMRIYYIYQDQYQLVFIDNIYPLAFQSNNILCRVGQNEESQLEQNLSLLKNNWIELQLIGISREFKSSRFKIRDSIENGLYFFDKYYIWTQNAIIPKIYIMVNNKIIIKCFLRIKNGLLDNKQLKHSNYYLTICFGDDDKLKIYIITKQQRNCKIIRKLKLETYDYAYFKENYTYVIERLQKSCIKITYLWNLKIEYQNIDLKEDSVLTKNNTVLVSSKKKCLEIKKLQ